MMGKLDNIAIEESLKFKIFCYEKCKDILTSEVLLACTFLDLRYNTILSAEEKNVAINFINDFYQKNFKSQIDSDLPTIDQEFDLVFDIENSDDIFSKKYQKNKK